MEVKEVAIKWQGRDEKVVIKRLTFGERNRLAEQCRDITFVGGVQKVKIFEAKLKSMSLKLGIKNAPFSLDDATIDNLDGALGEMLYIEIDRFNSLDQGNAGGPAGSQKGEAQVGDQARALGNAGPAENNGIL